MDDTYSRLLRDYWGYRTFRPHQREIIANAAQGHDVLAILPTGGGKSLTFHPPHSADGRPSGRTKAAWYSGDGSPLWLYHRAGYRTA